MRTARSGIVMAIVSVSLAFLGCGGSDSSSPSGLVQISHYLLTPGNVSCGAGVAAPDTIILQVEMVNTTGSDVTVSGVGSFGTIIRTSTNDFVGNTAGAFTSLPFTPQPTLLAAHTGDVTMRVSLPTVTLCSQNPLPAANNFKDVQMSARVSTNSGQYVSTTAIIHLLYPPF